MEPAETTEIGAFTAAVAGERVTPSGGGCAAVAAAMGAALCEMGSRHTSSDDDERGERRAALAGHRNRLLALADEDAAAVDALLEARRDGESDDVPAARKRATDVPLAIATESRDVLEAAADVLDHGPGPAGADVRTGAFLAHAAVRAAVATVRTNLESIRADDYAAGVEATAVEVTADAETALDRVTVPPSDG